MKIKQIIGKKPAKKMQKKLFFVTSAKSIFLRFVSKAREQRATDPPLETRNSTFDILDRAWK